MSQVAQITVTQNSSSVSRIGVKSSSGSVQKVTVKIPTNGIQKATVKIPGIQGPKGDPGKQGSPGISGIYLSYQIQGMSSFTARHTLPPVPRVTLLDNTGQEVETDTFHIPGAVLLQFPEPFTGLLYLS